MSSSTFPKFPLLPYEIRVMIWDQYHLELMRTPLAHHFDVLDFFKDGCDEYSFVPPDWQVLYQSDSWHYRLSTQSQSKDRLWYMPWARSSPVNIPPHERIPWTEPNSFFLSNPYTDEACTESWNLRETQLEVLCRDRDVSLPLVLPRLYEQQERQLLQLLDQDRDIIRPFFVPGYFKCPFEKGSEREFWIRPNHDLVVITPFFDFNIHWSSTCLNASRNSRRRTLLWSSIPGYGQNAILTAASSHQMSGGIGPGRWT